MMRPDLEVVADLVPTGSRVLDLGCGAGELLSFLALRDCRGTGVDTAEDAVLAAIRSGVSVVELDIDDALARIGADIVDAKTIMLLQWAALRGPFSTRARAEAAE